jgi:tyrosinase
MILRKNVTSLSKDEKVTLVQAFLKLKREGRYDEYVHAHHALMHPATYPSEPQDPDYRNGAHRGPVFLPWHRE